LVAPGSGAATSLSFNPWPKQLDGEARLRAPLLSATICPLLALAGTITVAKLVLFVLPRIAFVALSLLQAIYGVDATTFPDRDVHHCARPR
jgi:hypothetical protein